MNDAALYRLITWLSPAYPIGAYSYSHGLEWHVETGDVADAEGLAHWLSDVVVHGSGRNDVILVAHAWRAARNHNDDLLREVTELAAAFAPSRERHLETVAQGDAFIAATRAAWPASTFDRLEQCWDGRIALPVAVGCAAAAHDVDLEPTALAYLHAFTSNLIGAGVRLIPLGQTDGLRVLAVLESGITDTARTAVTMPLDALGGVAVLADIASMRHEAQYTRLFRS